MLNVSSIRRKLSLPIVGCSHIRSGVLGFTSQKVEKKTFEWFDAIMELGGNTFDTASIYQLGESERAIGRWMRTNHCRNEVILISKCSHPSLFSSNRVHSKAIRKDLNRSLERLQTNTIDFYLLHRDHPNACLPEIMHTLHEAVQNGYVKFIGVSNWQHHRIQEANHYAKKHNLTPFVVSSPHYSLAEWEHTPWEGCVSLYDDPQAHEWYATQEILVFAWSSLAQGFFSRKSLPKKEKNRNPMHWRDHCLHVYANTKNEQKWFRVHQLANKKDVSPSQIVLAYLYHQPFQMFPIIRTSNPIRFRENKAAKEIQLSHEECAYLSLKASDCS